MVAQCVHLGEQCIGFWLTEQTACFFSVRVHVSLADDPKIVCAIGGPVPPPLLFRVIDSIELDIS